MHSGRINRKRRSQLVLINSEQARHIKATGTIFRGICKLLEGLSSEDIGLRVRPLILNDLAILGLANDLTGQLRAVCDTLAQRSPMRGIRLHDCADAKFLPLVDQLLHEFFIGRVIRPDLVLVVPRVLCRGVDALVPNPQNLVVVVRGRGGVAC